MNRTLTVVLFPDGITRRVVENLIKKLETQTTFDEWTFQELSEATAQTIAKTFKARDDGYPIILYEYPYPHVTFALIAALRVCHETILRPEARFRTHFIDPEVFVRTGKDLREDTVLWRYQDDWKFKDLLETETLYFSGLEYLDDPLEGEPTESLREMIELVESPSRRFSFSALSFLIRLAQGMRSRFDWHKAFSREVCVNCWHIGHEDAMAFSGNSARRHAQWRFARRWALSWQPWSTTAMSQRGKCTTSTTTQTKMESTEYTTSPSNIWFRTRA